jgi:hypothetical protein
MMNKMHINSLETKRIVVFLIHRNFFTLLTSFNITDLKDLFDQ